MTRGPSKVRPERVAEQIRIEIADILQRELKDPRIGLATCTRVQVSGDLGVAKVYVGVLGGSEEQQTTMRALGHASGYVRHLLSQRLGLRHSPEIRFVFDRAVEFADRLEKLFEENRARSPEPDPENGEQQNAKARGPKDPKTQL